MSWVAALAQVAGALYGADQAGKAGDKQQNAANRNIQLQRDILGAGLRIGEPTRALGYGATSDLASLYGYKIPDYTPLNSLMAPTAGGQAGGSSNWELGAPIGVKGTRGKEDRIAGIDSNPLSNKRTRLGGSIDPNTGMVEIDHRKTAKQDKFSDMATAYLRGDSDELKGRKFNRVRSAIDALREQGYEWTDAPPEQQAGPIAPGEGTGTSPDGTAGNFSRFFTSPGYQFRLNEGQRDIGNSFAARGGAASGNALRALTEFNQNTASNEFGNYQNSLFNLAGMGQTANTQAMNNFGSFGANTSAANTAAGDARASGVMGAANSLMGGLNSAANTWTLSQYLKAMNSGRGG